MRIPVRQDIHEGAKSHSACSFPVGFSSGPPPTLWLFCGFALLWYCFLLVKSHNNGQQLKLGIFFHQHWHLPCVFGVFRCTNSVKD